MYPQNKKPNNKKGPQKNGGGNNGNNKRNFFIWLAVILFMFFASGALEDIAGIGKGQEIAFSQFISQVENREIAKAYMQGDKVYGQLKNGEYYSTLAPYYPNLAEKLQQNGVEITAKPLVSTTGRVIGGLLGWLPFIILIGFWWFMLRGSGGGAGKAMSFGKSRAKVMELKGKVTFEDVAGIDEAKEELFELVDFLKNPAKYTRLGAKIPKGCLLIGAPGTGKTLLARAIAGEAAVPFFSISGSDFVEMFVGVGASRVRDMFNEAKKNAPCIIFIDEIDAVGRHRGAGVGGGNDEREQTLNQLLVEMDGFEGNEGVIVIAATNRPDVLDKALLRPGRFDRQITVSLPDIKSREQILNVHIKKVKTAPDVDTNVIARGTPGFSGADLANLINESAILAARKNQNLVTMRELESAKDKIMMGLERKSMVMKDEEKKLTAYHEAGHAIVGIHCKNSDPIHKATIIPRGRALGLVMRLPESDRFSVSRAKLLDDIAVSMGGRVAEELIFGYDNVTTGASSDIRQATAVADAMVKQWGLSDKVGPVFHGKDENGQMGAVEFVADETLKMLDSEVRRFVNEGLQKAKKILTAEKGRDLEKLAQALLKYETLTGDQITDILAGKKIKIESGAKKVKASGIMPDVSDEDESEVKGETKSKTKTKAKSVKKEEKAEAKTTKKVVKKTKIKTATKKKTAKKKEEK